MFYDQIFKKFSMIFSSLEVVASWDLQSSPGSVKHSEPPPRHWGLPCLLFRLPRLLLDQSRPCLSLRGEWQELCHWSDQHQQNLQERYFLLRRFFPSSVLNFYKVYFFKVAHFHESWEVVYVLALEEAARRFQELKAQRESREALEQERNSRKPPPYKFIKVLFFILQTGSEI